MAEKQEMIFNFIASALPREKFALVRMDGREAVSELYQFTIDLVSADPEIDAEAIVNAPATIEIDRDGDVALFQGIVSGFDQADQGPEFVHYQAVLVPRLYRLHFTRRSRIFQEKTVRQILTDVLNDHGLAEGDDYEFKLTETGYPSLEYVVQYEETDLNFIRRMMEHDGIFFFFEHGETCEKLVMADSKDAYQPIAGNAEVLFRDARSLSPAGEAVGQFLYRQRILTGKVGLKDYNHRKPDLDVSAGADGAPSGTGELVEYGNHFKDPDDGGRLAAVRGGEQSCRERIYIGEGAVRGFRSGDTFSLVDHYRGSLNREYLLIEVEHAGRQLGIIGTASGGEPETPSYTNRFVAIPADVRFVPERITPKPRIYGTMHAVVDAAGSGRYAEIDSMGRYKVKIPFDPSDLKDGKASRFIRMAQPYVGPEWGMHFPLHRGAEVLLTHVDGDPDRPIIAAGVPNPNNGSPVTEANQTQCVLKSCSNNEFRYENQEGEEQIYLHGQRDWAVVMENDHSELIKHDQTTEIGNDRTETVRNNEKITIEGNRDESVTKNETISIGGNRSETVTGTESVTIEKTRSLSVTQSETISIGEDQTTDVTKNQNLEVGENRSKTVKGEETVNVKKDRKTDITKNDEVKVGEKFALIAGKQIQLQTGDASITIKENGDIEIKGKNIKILSGGPGEFKADGELTLKGSNTKIN